MYEDEEVKALKDVLRRVDFVVNMSQCEKMAEATGRPLDRELMGLVFADTLRQDIMLEHMEDPEEHCPPLAGKWRQLLQNDKEAAGVVYESICAAFRFGYYYAMKEAGFRYCPIERDPEPEGMTWHKIDWPKDE